MANSTSSSSSLSLASPAPISSTSSVRLGWTTGPNGRGTTDILWNCVLTMFLCCWSILVVNVPRPGTSPFRILHHKFFLLCLCLIGPEFIFQIALGQFLSARQSRAAFRAAGYGEWGLRHSFYVNMGALHLRTPDFKSFPIDAEQLLYLMKHHYVEFPQINEDAIRDKNKIDGMLRFITLIQAMWFIVNLVARSAQDLAISCLELSTSAWVISCLGTTICWSKKPADVEFAEFIDSKTPLAQILKEGGDRAQMPYFNTPLDFVNREEWAWSKLWYHGLSYLQAWGLISRPERPVQRIGDTVIKTMAGWWYALFVLVTLCYFAVFLAAWNFSFPSHSERLLWRIAALSGPLSAMGVCVSMHFCISWYPELKNELTRRGTSKNLVSQSYHDVEVLDDNAVLLSNLPATTAMQRANRETTQITMTISKQSQSSRASNERGTVQRAARWFRNNSTLKDPELDTPLKLILLTWIFGTIYISSRAYIAIEDFMEFRSLPASAYDTVDWTKFWPHL